MSSDKLLKTRYQFRKCVQTAESLISYIFNLQQLASLCDFCPKCLDENLRDQFISGISSDEIRNILLEETTLDFKTACDIAVNMHGAGSSDKMADGINTPCASQNTLPNNTTPSSGSVMSSNTTEVNLSSAIEVEASLPSSSNNIAHVITSTPNLCGVATVTSAPPSMSASAPLASGSNIVAITTVTPIDLKTNNTFRCFTCHEEGHFSTNCPNIRCYTCDKIGHVSPNCPQKKVRKFTKSVRGAKGVSKPRKAAQPRVSNPVINNYDIKVFQLQKK